MEIKGSVNVIGQMNVDFIYKDINRMPAVGEEIFADDFKIQLGGGPMVIPIQLSKLGIPSKLGTYLGDDYQSRIAGDLINGIDFRNIEILETTKIHPVVMTSVLTTKEERSFVCYNQGANELDVGSDQIYNFYKDSSICFCPQDINVARKLKSEGKILVYDVGWHDDLSLRSISHYLDVVDYFTPNEKECEKLTGTSDIFRCLDILEEFVKFPIMKLGARGCVCKISGEYIHVPVAMNVKTVDPTGAGDNFLTGLIYGLYHDRDILDCLKYANILGGLSTEVLGCYRDDISADILENFYSNYPKIHKLKAVNAISKEFEYYSV